MLRILLNLEDPNHPLLGPNIKALKFWGLIISKDIWVKSLHLFLHSISTSFTVMEYVNVWFVKSDPKLLSTNLKVAMLASVSVFKLAMFFYHQTTWTSIIEYVTKADLDQRTTMDKTKTRFITRYTSYCRKFTYTYWLLYYATVLIAVMLPVIKYFSSETYRENVKNGTESYQEVYTCWVPFDKNTIPGHIAASIYQTVAASHGGGWITSFDSTAMVLMVFFRAELEMLRKDCAYIFGDRRNSVEDDVVMERMKNCHRRQVELVKFSRLFDSCLSPVMLFYMFVCSVMLCLTVYQISIETNTLQKIQIAVFLMFGVAQLFIYCWHSNDVLYASQDLMLGPYESTWYIQDVKYRKDLYILMAQFNKTIVFSVGPFTTLTVATFINILKGTYSYYSLLSKS